MVMKVRQDLCVMSTWFKESYLCIWIGFSTLKTRQMFYFHFTPEKSFTGHLGVVFEENSDREIVISSLSYFSSVPNCKYKVALLNFFGIIRMVPKARHKPNYK